VIDRIRVELSYFISLADVRLAPSLADHHRPN
jgi:hypothetical protein